ncbi:hypothetical protein HOP50_06g40750 [Chloropicon primus]|uniref:TLC domain-containing protein n=1 Tax=Chloropicon primus TaxID=1764295 RepID=A0A5B8MLN6_9CHLO|nr:hypothetical protein A3770_06p40660 [Chloropicon primus]UPR00759.1 hypothetical protein HOP50_06g40750 [Chloropicon primus]|eukprot:QDZ21548.1 hypothetical protein A3770_06p40660 [Chloropicon primus]
MTLVSPCALGSRGLAGRRLDSSRATTTTTTTTRRRPASCSAWRAWSVSGRRRGEASSGGGEGRSRGLPGGRQIERDLETDRTGGGGGKLPPPRSLRVSFSGDDGDPQDHIPFGYGSFLALVLLVAKCLVCYCTEDVETAFMSIDLGFLTFLGWLCLFAFRAPSMAALHPFLIELGSAVIMEEMVFSMLLVNKIKPDLDYKVTKDFLVHHVSSAIMGWLALYFCTRALGTGFVAVGVIGTEVTTFLPVAFRESVRSKKISSDKRISAFLGVVFPAAFCWRTYWSSKMWLRLLKVGRSYLATSPVLANQVLWRIGELSVATVVGCNWVWTHRILKGSMKVAMRRSRGQKSDDQYFQKEIE